MRLNMENSLKRFLKRKVKITLGFVVAFMITGTVGYAEEQDFQKAIDSVTSGILDLNRDITYTTSKEQGYRANLNQDLVINGNGATLVYRNSTIKEPNSIINANGYKLAINDLNNIRIVYGYYGEEKNKSVDNIYLDLKNISTSNVVSIYGGAVANNVFINLENSSLDNSWNKNAGYLLAGGNNEGEDINGNVTVKIKNSTINRMVIGGGYGGSDVLGDTNITVEGTAEKGSYVNAEGIYGGGWTYDGAGSAGEVKGTATVNIIGNVHSGIVAGGGFNSGTSNDKGTKVNNAVVNINGDENSNITYVLGGGYTNWFAPNSVTTSQVNLNSGNVSEAYGGGRYVNGDKDKQKQSINRVDNTEIILNGANVENIYGGGLADSHVPQPSDGIIYYDRIYAKSEVGTTKIFVNSGNVENVYGGGKAIIYTNGDVENVQGNPNLVSTVENSSINISGGTIAGNVIGGGYAEGNEYCNATVGNSTITISGGEIQGKVIAGGETENAKVTGEAKIVIDVDNFQAKGIYSGYAGTSILELTENVKTFDSSLIEKTEEILLFVSSEENSSKGFGFNDFIVKGETEIKGGLENINTLHTVDNANAIIVENITNKDVDFNIDDNSKITLKTKENKVNEIKGTGTLVIDAEVKNGEFKINGGIETNNLQSTVKIGTTVTTDDLIGKDIQQAMENLNKSVVADEKNNTIEISEGKLFGATTGTATDKGVSDIKTEVKSNTVIGIEDLATINYLSWKQEMSSLTQRMGELRNSTADNGVWARVYGGKVENGSQYDNKYQTYQVGFDKKYNVDNGKIYLGYLVSYTDGETNYSLGSGENYSVGAGMYATWLNNNGHYVDVLYKVSRLTNKFDVYGADRTLHSTGEYDTWGVSLSGEYGRRFDVTDKWFVEPSVALTLGRLGDETYTTKNTGIEVTQDSIYTAEGRIGTAIGYNFTDKGNVYARVALVKEFAGDVDAEYKAGAGSLSTSEDLSDTWAEFGIGANYRVKENVNLYADLEKTGDATVDTKWQANLGFRVEF